MRLGQPKIEYSKPLWPLVSLVLRTITLDKLKRCIRGFPVQALPLQVPESSDSVRSGRSFKIAPRSGYGEGRGSGKPRAQRGLEVWRALVSTRGEGVRGRGEGVSLEEGPVVIAPGSHPDGYQKAIQKTIQNKFQKRMPALSPRVLPQKLKRAPQGPRGAKRLPKGLQTSSPNR